MSGGGGNWNPGQGLQQLSNNAGAGLNAIGNNFTQGANAFSSNLNNGKQNAMNNWNGVEGGLSNGSNYDPSKGTVGALAQGFTNGGDFNNGWEQIQGGWNQQAQPVLDQFVNNEKNTTGTTTAGIGLGAASGLIGGDPLLGAGIGATLGTGAGGLENTKADTDAFNQNQTNQAAQRQQNDQAAIQQKNQAATQKQQQAETAAQTSANQASYNNSEGLEDALRAAYLQKQGSRANANVMY